MMHTAAEPIHVLPHVVDFTDVNLDGHPYDVVMILNLTHEGIRPTSVTVTAQEGSPPVSGTTLRALRVMDLAKQATDPGEAHPLTQAQAAALRKQGPTDETLKWVARLYERGKRLGLPPARHVELELGLPRTTASKWVRRARETGLLNG